MNDFSIHDAARKGDLCRVRQLIEAGVSVDSLNEEGDTPLHVAACYGQYEVAGLLIDSECDLDIKDRYGRTPAMRAANLGKKDIVDLLLHRGAQVKGVDDDGWTLLHYASHNGCTDSVRLILDNGKADLNAADERGWTPLLEAVIRGEKDIAALLIQAGADTNIMNYGGTTALSEGITRRILSHEEIRLFVQNGAILENFDYEWISYHPFLNGIEFLKDVELCTQSVVNKFHHQSLPALNSITYFARRLPNVDNFKLGAQDIEEVENLVKCKIERNTLCDVEKVHPISLSALCVLSLITCQSGKKRAASPDFGHSSFKQIRN